MCILFDFLQRDGQNDPKHVPSLQKSGFINSSFCSVQLVILNHCGGNLRACFVTALIHLHAGKHAAAAAACVETKRMKLQPELMKMLFSGRRALLKPLGCLCISLCQSGRMPLGLLTGIFVFCFFFFPETGTAYPWLPEKQTEASGNAAAARLESSLSVHDNLHQLCSPRL